MEKIKEEINEVIYDYLHEKLPKLKVLFANDNVGTFSLFDDFGFDSVDVMDVIFILEAKYEKKIDNKKIAKVRYLNDLYNLFI